MTDAAADGAGAPVRVVLATHNQGKVVELRRLLGDALEGIEIVAYDGPEPVEDGDTFEANAFIKARAAVAHTGLPALADDSGISADALGGAPGIHSARYAGTRVDRDNYEKLLAELDAAGGSRAAHFTCAAVLVVPPPADAADEPAFEHVELGIWNGTVLDAPVGDGGHGYDPVFQPEGLDVSAAQLTLDEKNAISHRARAFTALLPTLRERLLG